MYARDYSFWQYVVYANIHLITIIQYYLVSPWLSTDLKKQTTLNDLEWQFYIYDDHRYRHFADE